MEDRLIQKTSFRHNNLIQIRCKALIYHTLQGQKDSGNRKSSDCYSQEYRIGFHGRKSH